MTRRLQARVVRAVLVVAVLLAAGFVGLLPARPASAQTQPTEIVIGLQNDMTTLNFWNPETNTVWNFYQIGWNFETLFSTDPDNNLFPVLADPSRPATPGPEDRPGYDIRLDLDPSGLTVDVFLRTGVTFHDGQPMDADDVVFSFQTKAWSTEQTVITEPLWWDAPRWPHWSGGGAVSHIGVEQVSATVVRFHLVKPFALFFLSTLAGVTIIPRHIWENHIDPTPPVNISNPGTRITDSADRSIDLGYGNNPTEVDSTIGTGFMKLDYWQRQVGSRLVTYDNHWSIAANAGHNWGGRFYPFYPESLRSIRFVIYTSLDVISLALQRGDIDTLIWSLTPGFLNQVRFNPAISVEQVTDAGYFYLAFNLRRKPWNDLDLRKAVSMAIDKDYIVNTLMGGFGIKGAQPISIHTPRYVNSSAVPPAFDLTGAQNLLNSVGIVDRDGDGFREYKDGTPIRTTILTPPKDYDPVRADAGIMISNNLKRIGLNIDSAPTSFDTIVSKAFTEVDFDIYILGWLLTGFPELYIKDFFHCSMDVAINPAGSNSAGYCNPTVDRLIDTALVTLDDDQRIQMVKDIQGIVVKDLPWNVLYYRKNLNAYRNDRWVGWVNTPPQIYNFWSLVKLRPAGAVVVPPPSGALNIAMTVPERALANHDVIVETFVSQNLAPVSGATVTLTAAFGTSSRAMTATTDVGGKASFTWRAPVIQGTLFLTAEAQLGTATGTATKLVEVTVGPPAPIATLLLSTPTPVIGTGDTATITASVTDGLGAGIGGVTVTVDTTLILGTISPSRATTNAAGVATFTYTAPPNADRFPNQHLSEIVKANVSVPDTIAVDTQSASLVLFVENDNAPDWYIVDVQGTPNPVLRAVVDPTETFQVLVTNFAGVPQRGVVVEAVVEDPAIAVASPVNATTDAAGMATFTLGIAPAAPMNVNTNVRFRVEKSAFQASDQVALLVTDMTATGYGAVLDVTARALQSSPVPDRATVTATVYRETGTRAAPGEAAVILQISYGDLGLPAQFDWAYDYTYAGAPYYLGQGLDLNFFGAGSLGPAFENSVGQGTGWGVENFVEDVEVVGNVGALTGVFVDSCDPTTWPADFDGTYNINATGFTDVNGQVSDEFFTVPHRIDSGVQIRAWVGPASGPSRLEVEVDACNFVAHVNNAFFMIDTGVVIRRAPVFALGSVSFDNPILSSEDRFVNVTARFYDRGGGASDVQVFFVRGAGSAARNVANARTSRSGAFYGTLAADANGVLTWEVAEQYTRGAGGVTIPPLSLSQAIYFSFIPADPRYAYGGREQLFAGPAGENFGDFWFAPTFAVLIAKIPFDFRIAYLFVPATVAFATVDVDRDLLGEGETATATVTVTTGLGVPIPGAKVWSGAVQNETDANGVATLPFTGVTLGALEQLVVVTTADGQVLRAWFGLVVSRPVLRIDSVAVTTAAPAGRASTITVRATNTLPVSGPATVELLVDGRRVAAQIVQFAASESKDVVFRYTFEAAGSYTVSSGGASATATIGEVGADLSAAIGIGVGLLIVGLIVGLLIGRRMGRPGRPAEAPAEEPKEAEAAEVEEK